MTRKLIKPPTFDRETRWPNSRTQYEAATDCNYWNNTVIAIAFILALRRGAVINFPKIPTETLKDHEADIERLLWFAYLDAPNN